jgi:DNA-binding MarR family transcriptional regulator
MESSVPKLVSGEQPDLARLFGDLVRFETELWNALDEVLRSDPGLPLAWFEPMRFIHERGSSRVNDIAEEFGITVGGVSKVIDRIEAAGHCRRRPNPSDRRSSLIELTPAGRRLLSKARVSFDEVLEARLASGLSASALTQLARTLRKLRSPGTSGSSTSLGSSL